MPPFFPRLDAPVTLVARSANRPKGIRCRVFSNVPLSLSGESDAFEGVEPGPALLVWRDGERLLRADVEIVRKVGLDAVSTLAEIRLIGSVDLEKRQHHRYPFILPVALRAVDEPEGNPSIVLCQGHTRDLSLGGSWVSVRPAPQAEDLVEFHAVLSPGVVCRALAIVVHADEQQGVRLAFLDYLESSQRDLDRFLAAA